jgi:hypothetical protein
MKYKVEEETPMQVSRNSVKNIQNVLYDPSLKENLLPISKITDDNFIGIFYKKQCLIKDQNNKSIARGVQSNDMYRFEGLPNKQCFLTCYSSKNWLWNERYGHLNYFYLDLLHKNNLVNGLPQIAKGKGVCEACLAGKHLLKFDNSKTR